MSATRNGSVTRMARRMRGQGRSWAAHAAQAKQLLRGSLIELASMEHLSRGSTNTAAAHVKVALQLLGEVWPDYETK